LIDRLLCLLVILTVSTTSAEQTFSSLKIIKTRQHNKMDDDYLANSLLIHIEGEIIENYTNDDIITDFKDMEEKKESSSKQLCLMVYLYFDIC
jgi:hypothetical protein